MMIDISRLMRSGMAGYPGDPPFVMKRGPNVDRGDEYSFTSISMHSHCGTHLDAPRHFIAGGAEIGDFPLEAFNPLAEVIDCRGLLGISARHLEACLTRDDTAVLLLTDASEFGDGEYVAEHPALTVDAAQFLVSRQARLVGIDYLSVERDGDGSFPVHHVLLGAGFLLLEHLCLAGVKPGLYRLTCLPLKLDGAEAAPCRAVLTGVAEKQ
ncbi:cyclase family protein [bacterium]|nr:cyclase family protein [bacterium]